MIDDRHPLIYLPEAYDGAREEQEDRGVEEEWEESDEGTNIPPLEHHKTDLPLASSKEVGNWAKTAFVLRKPLFEDHGAETGVEAGGETGKPEAVDRDRGTGGFKGDGWVGYVC